MEQRVPEERVDRGTAYGGGPQTQGATCYFGTPVCPRRGLGSWSDSPALQCFSTWSSLLRIRSSFFSTVALNRSPFRSWRCSGTTIFFGAFNRLVDSPQIPRRALQQQLVRGRQGLDEPRFPGFHSRDPLPRLLHHEYDRSSVLPYFPNSPENAGREVGLLLVSPNEDELLGMADQLKGLLEKLFIKDVDHFPLGEVIDILNEELLKQTL